MQAWKATIFLLAALQGILLSIALISRYKKEYKANPFLGILLFTISTELILAWAFETNYFARPDRIPFWMYQSYLAIPPAFLFYCQINFGKRVTKKMAWIAFIPAILEIAIENSIFIYSRFTEHYINLIDYTAWFVFAEMAPLAWMIVVIFKVWKNYLALKKQAIKKPLNNSLYLLGFITIVTCISIFWCVAVFTEINIFTVLNFLFVFMLFALGYLAFRKPAYFKVNVAGEAFQEFDHEKDLKKLVDWINENKSYEEPGITLNVLAKQLDLPQRYVSFLINQYHDTNFQTFINTFRVEAVKQKLSDPAQQNKTILALALESGFNSKSSFNKVFKEITGENPSDYLPAR